MVRIEHLKRRSEFLHVAAGRRKWATPGLILQARQRDQASQPMPGPENLPCRVGFTASRRVGGAVERNRAKRRLRAVVDRVIRCEAAAGYDYVVIARPEALDRPFEDLVSDMKTALARLGTRRPTMDAAPAPTQANPRSGPLPAKAAAP
jgi:ribonuclease P protein component